MYFEVMYSYIKSDGGSDSQGGQLADEIFLTKRYFYCKPDSLS